MKTYLTSLTKRLLIGSAFAATLGSPVYAQDTIDVMMLYTPQAKAHKKSKSAMETYINYMIDEANAILKDSRVRTRVRLAHIDTINNLPSHFNYSLNVPKGSDAKGMLPLIREDARVKALRAEHGADQVTVIGMAPSSGLRTCGKGYLASGNGEGKMYVNSAKSYAFSVIAANCSTKNFIHELGHNLGLGHSAKQLSRGSVYHWGKGHGIDYSFVTLMPYAHEFNGVKKIYRFSDPSRSDCLGRRCGVNKDSKNIVGYQKDGDIVYDGADSVSAINAVSARVAGYLPSKFNVNVDTGSDDDDNGSNGDNSGNDGSGSNGGGTTVNADPVKQLPPIAGNLIDNPGAENGLDSWKTNFGANISLSNIRRYNGESSIHVHKRSSNTSGLSQYLTGKMTAGTYKFSAAMRLSEGSAKARVVIGIQQAGSKTQYNYDMKSVGINSNQWTMVTGEFTVNNINSNTEKVFVHFYGPAAQYDFYVDHVSIVPVNTDTGFDTDNIIGNGDFEQANLQHWEASFDGSVSLSTISNMGEYGIKSHKRKNWYDGIKQDVIDKIKPNKTYELSAWVKRPNSTSQVIRAELYYRDDSGHHWVRFDKKQVAKDWVNFSGSINIQPEGEIKHAYISFFGPQPGRIFYVDDVELIEK